MHLKNRRDFLKLCVTSAPALVLANRIEAYDDDGIYVLNSLYQPFSGLEVSATLYSFDLTQKLTRKAKVNVDPDGKTLAFRLAWPPGLSRDFQAAERLVEAV